MQAFLSNKAYRLNELDDWQIIPEGKDAKILFVDGGNSCIIRTPDTEIHQVRTAVVVVSGKKLKAVTQKEGYVMAKTVATEGKMLCIAETYNSNLEFKGKVETEYAETNSDTPLSKTVERLRRLCELEAARGAVRNTKDCQFIILDGTLETFGREERSTMEALKSEAEEKKIIVGALAKTCSLLTAAGKALIEEVATIAKETGYCKVADASSESHRAEIGVAKLNSNSSYLFRTEAAGSLKEVVFALIHQSNDLAFPGYPYGLVMVDKFARVSDIDAELARTKMKAGANPETRMLLKNEKALNAHSVLDSM